MSLSGSMLNRPSLDSVQLVSQGGRVEGTVSAHTDVTAASPSVSGLKSAFNKNEWKTSG